MHRKSIFSTLGALFSTVGMPRWYARLTTLLLLPVALWPFVLIASVMLFDHPDDLFKTLGLFLLLVSYPIWLLGMVVLSRKMFYKIGKIAVIVPLAFLVLIGWGLLCIWQAGR